MDTFLIAILCGPEGDRTPDQWKGFIMDSVGTLGSANHEVEDLAATLSWEVY